MITGELCKKKCGPRLFRACPKLRFRDVEDLLAERGITLSYEAIRVWRRKFGPVYVRIPRRRQGRLGERVFSDWEKATSARCKRVTPGAMRGKATSGSFT